MKTPNHLLHDLARLFKVQTVHYDAFGRLVTPSAETILRVLRMLGAEVERLDDVPDALRARRQYLWQRAVDPVVIAWDGAPARFRLRLPSGLAETEARFQITLETGERLEGVCRSERAKPAERTVEGVRYVTRRLSAGENIPPGYHRINVQVGERNCAAFLFSSFVQSHRPADGGAKRWGVFCPLYALHSERSWGAGDFSDLDALVNFTAEAGGDIVGTLPLLAAFLDEPFNHSPYAPVSRFFWNEFYLDVQRVPELERSAAARALLASSSFQDDLAKLRAAPLIEYRKAMALKRAVLEELLRSLWRGRSQRKASFESFIAAHPLAQDYAAFRAKTERERKPWEQWPAPSRGGKLEAGDYDEDVMRYHLYVQWQAHDQMAALGEKAKAGGPALYLDFPLGVNRDGYDVWREREVFALDASGGAPPDAFFTQGQNWGFPPLAPEGLQRQGYRYYIHCLRHHLRYAGMLRIDHVMGLHRFYWIPHGLAATEGLYVHYPSEEMYAIVNLESRRHQAEIVGENLGTVPPYVNRAMARHKISGMDVSQFRGAGDFERGAEVGADTVASLNTHDTPTFNGFWTGGDIQDRLELGLITEADTAGYHGERAHQRAALMNYLRARGLLHHDPAEPAAVLRAWLESLAQSPAALVLVNLEDLWLEPAPQNVPGTWEERPNWRRRARHSLEELRRIDALVDTLRSIREICQRRR